MKPNTDATRTPASPSGVEIGVAWTWGLVAFRLGPLDRRRTHAHSNQICRIDAARSFIPEGIVTATVLSCKGDGHRETKGGG